MIGQFLNGNNADNVIDGRNAFSKKSAESELMAA